MDFKRTVPASSGDLAKFLAKLHENRSHIQSVRVDAVTGRIDPLGR